MDVSLAQRKSGNNHIGLITRSSSHGLAFSHLRPQTLIILGLVLLATSIIAIQKVRSQSIDVRNADGVSMPSLDSPGLGSEPTANAALGADGQAIADDSPQAGGVTSEGQTNSAVKTSIVIESSGQTTVNGETTDSTPQVTINGTPVELPKSGSYRQNTKDDNSRTRIRTKVDSDSASLNISTNESVDSGSD